MNLPRTLADKGMMARMLDTPLKDTGDGLHLANSILWFDSRLNGELSFLSSALDQEKSKVPQVIATEETVRLLSVFRRKPNALVCQYNRPFSIGRLKMELLPSGSVLGGASLYVEAEDTRILYAPQLQTQRIPTVRQMQLKRAHVLIVGALHPDPTLSMPNRKKERERLLDGVLKAVKLGKAPVILANAMTTAQEVTKLLSDEKIPVCVHSTIHRINKIYEEFGASLGSYSLYSRRRPKDQVTIFPINISRKQRISTPLPSGPIFAILDHYEESGYPSAWRDVQNCFYLGVTCDGPELREVVSVVSPKQLYLYGPYTKRYCEELKNLPVKPRALFENDQPTLF